MTEEVKTSYQERKKGEKKERKTWRGHGSAHGKEKIKGGAALWGQGEIEKEREEEREGKREREKDRETLAVHWGS